MTPTDRAYAGPAASSRLDKDSGRSLQEVARDRGVEEVVLDEALDYRAMTRGGLRTRHER